MARFRTGKNKQIQFGFGAGGVGAERYKEVVGHYHTGVDYTNGYGTPVYSDNFGRVFKIELPEDSASGWCGVYYEAYDRKYGFVEVCQGHLSRVDVKVGQLVIPGTRIGLEGNRGEVYYGGIRITKEMQLNGDERGSHVHEQFRPFRKVARKNKNKHYINKDGVPYRDANGKYYEILFDNETRGCVNPYNFISNLI